MAIYGAPEPTIAVVAPTGFGKSPLAIAVAAMLKTANARYRAAYLTETKGLQGQLQRDFAAMGLTDIRGQANYECRYIREHEARIDRCDNGPCHVGVDCSLKPNGCTYYDAYRHAKWSDLVLTNYDYWLNIYRGADKDEHGVGGQGGQGGLGVFDLLILDEAHGAPDKLSDFLAADITGEAVEGVLGLRMPARDVDIEGWGEWAWDVAKVAQTRYDSLVDRGKAGGVLSAEERHELRVLRNLLPALHTVMTAARDAENWVVDRSKGNDARFDPIWPAPYIGELVQGVERVLLLSATIRPKTLDLLGFDKAARLFLEYPSSFPVANRPVIYIPTVQMKYPFTEAKNRAMLRRIDQIIGQRRDRKGIVHTVSYERARYIVEHSAHRDIMLLTQPRTTEATVRRFKEARGGCVLVSPAVSTGYDFPGDECRYQVHPKLSFPPTLSPVMKARTAADPDYTNYLAMQDLVQQVGRGVRSEDDWSESFILDDSWKWFRWKAAAHAPKWFLEACRESSFVPAPLY